MFARRSASDPTYRKSQASTGLPVQPSPVARGLCIAIIDCGDDPAAPHGGVPPCALVVADRAQVHEHDGQRLQSKTYGSLLQRAFPF